MLAVLALICFVIVLFHGHFAGIDFLALGFCFVAAHLAFGLSLTPWRRSQT
jgi:hypothetical protein